MKNKWIYSIVGLLFFSGCQENPEKIEGDTNENASVNLPTTLPYYNEPTFTPIWQTNQTDTLHEVGTFTFTNQYGNEISEKDFEHKIYLTNFFFTNCGGICPKMMRNMERVELTFKDNEEVCFLSHSVMPETDTPEKLLTYCGNFEVIRDKWHLVTGEKEAIYDMAMNQYFAEEQGKDVQEAPAFLHTEHFILVDRNNHIRGIYNGTLDLEIDRAIEDIKLLLQ